MNITIEVNGLEVVDVLKILAKKSGLNIVAGKNVRGTVSIFLQNVEVRKALRIILSTAGLAYDEREGIINVMTRADYEAVYGVSYDDKRQTEFIRLTHVSAQEVKTIIDSLRSTVGEIIVNDGTNALILIDTPTALASMRHAIEQIDVPQSSRVFILKYATAEDIEEKLAEVITPNFGMLKIDERTNKIVVRDTPAKINTIADMITAFDEKPRQVLMEAKIVEVTLDDEYVLGIDWDAIFKRTDASPITFESQEFGGITVPGTSGPLSDAGNSLPVFTLNNSSNDFHVIITALEGMGKTNILSNPRVTVLNNEEATIAVATRQPFVSQTVVQGDTTSTTADNVEFVDVGVTLSVKATISDDDYILTEVKPEVSTAGTPLTLTSADSNGQQFTRTVVPVVTSQEVETKVLVKTGTTIVLGGLIQDSESVTVKKLPLLGDIPLVGALFRNKVNDFKKTELVVFITPRIIHPDVSTREEELYFDENGQKKEFNDIGGPSNEFYNASQDSQFYLDVHDEPYWQKNRKLNGILIQKYSDVYSTNRETEVQNTIAGLTGEAALIEG
jgi:MSHA type pilus biogenesis protein MshL